MKKLGRQFLIGTAFAVSAAALVGCSPTNGDAVVQPGSIDTTTEIPVAVYGPPEDFTDYAETSSEANQEYDTTTEINGDVYGPPVEDFE